VLTLLLDLYGKMGSKGITWIAGGIFLAVGISLSAIGISLFVKNKSLNNFENPETYSVYFDSKSLVMEFNSNINDHSTKLQVQVLQSLSGLESTSIDSSTSCDSSSTLLCEELVIDGSKAVNINVKEIQTAPSDKSQCFEINWTSYGSVSPVDCIAMTGSWFGGSQMYLQKWPLNSWNKHMSFYLTGDMFSDAQQYGSVLERYWLSSNGVAVFVDPEVPLHVSTERGQICLKGNDVQPYKKVETYLKYTVCLSDSPQNVHKTVLELGLISKPQGLPDLRMIKSPIWSTWAKFKININETVIINYAKEILDNGFSNSQIEIDDGYEYRYGDHTFDENKFSDAKNMISNLHELGFRVTTWVTPFINPASFNYEDGIENNYYVINGKTGEAGKIVWWNGIGRSIDFTNPSACDWYHNMLEEVKTTYGVDSFKFDAGELNYIYNIEDYTLSKLPHNDLGFYTKKYVECVSRFGNQIEVRAAYRNQNLPIFVRMFDKDSKWSYEKGLKTLIPTALTYSVIGYPYILPDMIGGNAYGSDGSLHETSYIPERQLYIRWLQITAFLPSMQFSISPWQYDEEVTSLALKYVNLHESVVYEEIVSSSNDYVNGKSHMGPIRPIWWVAKGDEKAYTIDDMFLVGDRYLVAPIVEQNATSRDVYLPGPYWRDGNNKEIWWKSKLREGEEEIRGGRWLFDYPIALEEIAWWEIKIK